MKPRMWRATFKAGTNVDVYDRRKWVGFDLEVTLPAADQDDAREKVFEVARQYIANPYLGDLEEVRA